MKAILTKIHTSQGRILAGIGMMIALAIGLQPDHPREFDLGKASAVFAAIIAWLFAEIGDGRAVSQADIALYRRIKGVVNAEVLSFLQQHDFGASFPDRQISPIGEICAWHGADVEFVDPKLQKSWQSTVSAFELLNRSFARLLGPAYREDRLCAIPPGTDEWNIPQHLTEAVDMLNAQSNSAYDAFNQFDRMAKSRLIL